MYRKRKQLMELAVCGIDALAVIFSLFVEGMIRYQSLRELMWRENPQELCSMIACSAYCGILFSESI